MLNPRPIALFAFLALMPAAHVACTSEENSETAQDTGADDEPDASIDGGDGSDTGGAGAIDPDASSMSGVGDGGFDPGNLPGGGFVTIEPGDGGALNILCGNEPCVCADGKDNESDGLIDGFDPECTGPFDNDEGTFATGVPGDNRDPKWQDCFFDGNSGAGDDGCRYHTDCITGKATPESDPKMCAVSEACVNYCEPLVPPGCDCFGCCDVTVNGEKLNILVGEACSVADIEDEAKCPRCVPTTACNNECGECELCVGKTLEQLPAKCFEQVPPPDPGEMPPPPNSCDGDLKPCGPDAPCGDQAYCSLGCCKFIPNIR